MKKAIKHAVTGSAALAMALTLACCAVSANSKQVTRYGTVDWSSANQGYISFTARGEARCFILEGPNSAQTFTTAQEGENVRAALTDGTGRYQYAIANARTDNKTCTIMYKNSFIFH